MQVYGGGREGGGQYPEDRFASLIEAFQFHLQQDLGFADGQLVQSRLETIDPNVYTREQCSSFKQLLKAARTSGLDINWDQTEAGVTVIRMQVKNY